jgi:hypothetical protein
MEETTRADRRGSQRDRNRRRNRIVLASALALLVFAGVVVAIVASGGGDDKGQQSTGTATRDTTTVDLPIGDVSTASAGPNANFSAAQAADLVKVIRAYVDDAIVTPLRSGGEPADLSTVFDQGTLARVTGPDKPVMTDAGMPKVEGPLTVRSQPIAFVALGDQGGNVVLVSASIDLAAEGSVAHVKEPLHVGRVGDLVLAPDGAGGWKVTSYSISVNRTGGGVGPTTTAAPATTKAAK